MSSKIAGLNLIIMGIALIFNNQISTGLSIIASKDDRPLVMRLCRNGHIYIYCCFVIPGLIRNLFLFQVFTFLDAGSSPA
jgi:hypothetical protein